MSYQTALAAAGAVVIDTKYAGSYQGTWGSIVEYQGKKGLVTGSFGSCSVCDAFQSEFDDYMWGSVVITHDTQTDTYSRDYGDIQCTKEEYDAQQAEYQQKLSDFGKRYLHVIQDKWDVENQLKHLYNSEDAWYADEQKELLDWALPLLS
jgi:hypothetical protein